MDDWDVKDVDMGYDATVSLDNKKENIAQDWRDDVILALEINGSIMFKRLGPCSH